MISPSQLRLIVAVTFTVVSMMRGATVCAQRGGIPIDYRSSISADADGPLDLKAVVDFDRTQTGPRPIAVVMHEFSADTTFASVFANSMRLKELGFLTVRVAMRGRDGSDGVRDSGGLEIYDIFDAVEHVKEEFADEVDPASVYITGYSGGGGNTMSALTKFPDYFRVGASFVGMSDYGFDPINGWYFQGAGLRTAILDADIGDPTTGDPDVIDRYHARASNLASKNNPHSEIWLFSNQNEVICPIINDTSYRDNAIAAASSPGEFDNIRFINGMSGVLYQGEGNPADWVDWNENGTIESDERQDYPHSAEVTVQARGEAWFIDRLIAGSIPEPTINDSDRFFIAGWVRTKAFEVFLGDGQNAAGELDYAIAADRLTMNLDIISHNQSIEGSVTIQPSILGWGDRAIQVLLNGQEIHSFAGGVPVRVTGFGDGDSLEFIAVPEPCFGGGGLAMLIFLASRRCQR